jgi:hypothetical protein
MSVPASDDPPPPLTSYIVCRKLFQRIHVAVYEALHCIRLFAVTCHVFTCASAMVAFLNLYEILTAVK